MLNLSDNRQGSNLENLEEVIRPIIEREVEKALEKQRNFLKRQKVDHDSRSSHAPSRSNSIHTGFQNRFPKPTSSISSIHDDYSKDLSFPTSPLVHAGSKHTIGNFENPFTGD